MALITLAIMGMGHIQVKHVSKCFPLRSLNFTASMKKTVMPQYIFERWTCLQGWVHLGFYGKPKAVVVDSFDRKLAKRDGRILQQIREEEEARTGHKKSFFS